MTTATDQLTGLSIADTSGPIMTFNRSGSRCTILSKALAIPAHLGGAWHSIDYLLISPTTGETQPLVGAHEQGTDTVYFVHRGRGLLTTNGVTDAMTPGSLAILPGGSQRQIQNASDTEPMGILVIALRSSTDKSTYRPPSFHSLVDKLQETNKFHPVRVGQQEVRPRVIQIDLSDFAAAPWGTGALIEIPAGGRVTYNETFYDENIFVVSGNASIEIASERFHSTSEHGLNALIPKGMQRKLINRSSLSPLTILSVLAR